MEEVERRWVEMETRMAFQEQALTELNEALVMLRADHERQARLLDRAIADLSQLRGLLYADPTAEPPPPHY